MPEMVTIIKDLDIAMSLDDSFLISSLDKNYPIIEKCLELTKQRKKKLIGNLNNINHALVEAYDRLNEVPHVEPFVFDDTKSIEEIAKKLKEHINKYNDVDKLESTVELVYFSIVRTQLLTAIRMI